MKSMLIVAVACILPSVAQLALAAESRPNVLMIVSDDQGWTDFGFMGHEVIRTPHLDRLAGQSVLFTHGYVTAPLCRPSLASILTGRYGFQTNICGNNPPDGTPRTATHGFIRDVPTLPRLLGKAGYRSLQTGKFWEGDFANAGFTHGATGEEDRHGSTDSLAIGRDGLRPVYDFIEGSGDKPWFVWYAPFMPHAPHTPPQRILDKYLAPGRPEKLAKYWAMCEWFDETCGEILGWLEEHQLRENTLVVFIVDNGWIQETGPVRKNLGWFADKSKTSPYDGGLRTPILLSWPGKLRPQKRSELVSAVDLAPTILTACGLRPDAGMGGTDLLSVISGKLDITERPVFSETYIHTEVELRNPSASLTHRIVHQRDWSLILPQQGQPELYNVRDDPTQEKNLADREPDRVKHLAAMLDGWWKPILQK